MPELYILFSPMATVLSTKILLYLKVCEALQAICDTSVTNHSQAHVHEVIESVATANM